MQSLFVDDVFVELLEIDLIIFVGITLLKHPIHQLLVFLILLLISIQNVLELLRADLSIMVKIEVVKCKFEVFSAIGGWFR